MSHRHQVPSGVEVTPLTLWVCEFWGCDRWGCEGHGCERCGREGAVVKTRDEQCDIHIHPHYMYSQVVVCNSIQVT